MNNTTDLENRLKQLEERVIKLEKENNFWKSSETAGEKDSLFDEVVVAIKGLEKVSASYIQRRFRIGYARAARILDELTNEGFIEEGRSANPRKVVKKT